MSALPKGSLVLVTGANGFIASHVADQLLQLGYRVRGTVREEAKGAWLREYVSEKYGADELEIVIVPDLSADGAFDEVVKGVSAFIHIAADLSFSDDAEKVISATKRGVHNVLNACAAEKGVKSLVFTSTNWAIAFPHPNVARELTLDTWNEESVELAWDDKLDPWPRAMHVYGASKVAAEKLLFEQAVKKLDFNINTVVPNFNFGPLLSPGKQYASSGDLVPNLLQKGWEGVAVIDNFPPQHFVDVRDTARMHIAPLLDLTINAERLLAINHAFTWNEVVHVLKKVRPQYDVTAPRDKKEDRDLYNYSGKQRTEELLLKHFGQSSMRSLEDTIEASIAHVE